MKNVKKPNSIEWNEPLSKALTILMDSGTAVFVVKQGRYLGLIDDRSVNLGVLDPSNIKCSKKVTKSPTLNSNSTVGDGLSAFLSGKYKALPVLDKNNKLVAMVTKVELIKEILENDLVPQANVSEYMKTPVYTLDYSSTIGHLRSELKSKKVHKLLVVEQGRPRGIVSTFDLSTLVMKPRKRDRAPIISEVKHLDDRSISELIRERVFSVEVGTSLYEAMKVMIKRNVSNLLVTSNKRPVGVLSSTDLFKELNSRAKRKWKVSVSGLNREEDRQFYPMIVRRFEATLKKYSKAFKITGISIHFKRKKSVFEARVRLNINGKTLNFSKNWHEIPHLVDYLVREIKNVLKKKKSKRSGRRKKAMKSAKRRYGRR